MTSILESVQNTLGDRLPAILGAIGLLVLGWIAALIVRLVVRKSLALMRVNERIQSGTGSKLNVEGGVARGAFYVVLLLALIGFFNVLNLGLVSSPLQKLLDQVFAFLPRLAGGAILLLTAWIIATVLRKIVSRALGATTLDDKLSADTGMPPLSSSLGNVVYWLVFLLFLPAVLGALGLDGLLLPVQGMLDKVVGMIPNVFAAVVIGFVGWMVARLLRDLITNLLAATGIDRLGAKAGLGDKMPLSKLVGVLVYVFTFVPALIAALEALQIVAISRPATEMLGTLMAAIPNLFAATVIVAVAYYVSRFIADLATNLLGGVGFDSIHQKLGVPNMFQGELTPSKFVGKLIIFFAMVFASVEGANRLGFSQISGIVERLLEFGGQVLLGTVIIAVGLWISNLAHRAILGVGGPNSGFLSGLARYTIVGLVFAMGLRAMGIADDIVNLAFGLTLGAVAVAVALSFGLGGREAAGRQMEHWMKSLRND